MVLTLPGTDPMGRNRRAPVSPLLPRTSRSNPDSTSSTNAEDGSRSTALTSIVTPESACRSASASTTAWARRSSPGEDRECRLGTRPRPRPLDRPLGRRLRPVGADQDVLVHRSQIVVGRFRRWRQVEPANTLRRNEPGSVVPYETVVVGTAQDRQPGGAPRGAARGEYAARLVIVTAPMGHHSSGLEHLAGELPEEVSRRQAEAPRSCAGCSRTAHRPRPSPRRPANWPRMPERARWC